MLEKMLAQTTSKRKKMQRTSHVAPFLVQLSKILDGHILEGLHACLAIVVSLRLSGFVLCYVPCNVKVSNQNQATIKCQLT